MDRKTEEFIKWDLPLIPLDSDQKKALDDLGEEIISELFDSKEGESNE